MRFHPFLALLTGLSATLSSFAGTQSGLVTKIYVRASDGINAVYLSGAPAGRPACATFPYWIIKDENSTAGKKQLALLVAAQATGKTISIEGAGVCSRWPDGEDILGISTE
jgi:hypothetical protein